MLEVLCQQYIIASQNVTKNRVTLKKQKQILNYRIYTIQSQRLKDHFIMELAAGLAKGEGKEHIYIVEPTGQFENDPNVTDKKFPGNLTCSYRSIYPLKIIGEEIDFTNQTDEELS